MTAAPAARRAARAILPRLALVLAMTLAACAPRQVLRAAPEGAEAPAAVQTVFVATSRLLNPDLSGTGLRAEEPTFARVGIGIPPDHLPGEIEYDAGEGFAAVDSARFADARSFAAAVQRAAPADPDADVVVFVHGYNTTLGEAVYRQAQLAHDVGTGSPQVAFSWPSAAQPLGYVRDRDSILVARDDLEALLLDLSRGDRRILLVAHSMGAQLAMETLRQMSIGDEARALGRISGVVLISPDIDMDLFERQLSRIEPRPPALTVILSRRDRILLASALLTGRGERLGSTSDIDRLRDLGVIVVDLTGLSGQGANEHLLAATSPAGLELLQALRSTPVEVWRDDPSVLDLADNVLVDLGPG